MSRFDLCAVGFTVLDTLCTPADEMPPNGGATFVDQMTMTVAGTAGSTAYVCAMLGMQVRLATELGADPMGDWLVNALGDADVDTSLITRNKEVQTPMSMLPIGQDGARRAFFTPGTASTFTMSDDAIERATDARFVHLGGIGLLTSFDGERSEALLRRAKEKGRTTTLDLILADERAFDKVKPLLPFVDYFIPSIDEATAMVGPGTNANIARRLKQFGARNVLVTLESEGVWIDPENGEAFQCPATEITAVDTTGCGDSFSAGIIVGLSRGWTLADSAEFANAVAAEVAQGLGSQGRLGSGGISRVDGKFPRT